jgi:hypothetical protein
VANASEDKHQRQPNYEDNATDQKRSSHRTDCNAVSLRIKRTRRCDRHGRARLTDARIESRSPESRHGAEGAGLSGGGGP